uniref:Uncharacterized protein n=1 Tax=Graphocephala atropunctata TaxID=36148 RepID=A0A1B6LQU9_9HEMI
MATLLQNGNLNWMSMAKMFLNRLKEQPAQRKPEPSTSRQKPKITLRKMPRRNCKTNTTSCQLHEEQLAVISQFENLRKQLLYQLLVYQKQLLALKMPTFPNNSDIQQGLPNRQKQKVYLKQKLIYPKKKNLKSESKKWEKTAEVTTLFNRKNKMNKETASQQSQLKGTRGKGKTLARKETATKISVSSKEGFINLASETNFNRACSGKIPTTHDPKIFRYFSKNLCKTTFDERTQRRKNIPTPKVEAIDMDLEIKNKKYIQNSYRRTFHQLSRKNTKKECNKTVKLRSYTLKN